MAFDIDKAAILDIIKNSQCKDAKYINANTSSYSDLLTMLLEFSKTFDCNQTYLPQLLDVIDDATLVGLGVYYNKTDPTVNNPKVIVNSTYTTVNINAGGDFQEVQIFNSTITNIIVDNETQVACLSIGAGSVVTKLDVKAGSCIDVVLVKACNAFNSTLDKIVENSCIRNLGVDEDAIFNGYTCEITIDS